MKRVAHVVRKYDPDQWGGTETHVVEVTRRLRDHGFAAEVHAPRGPSATDAALAPHVPLVRFRSRITTGCSPARIRWPDSSRWFVNT